MIDNNTGISSLLPPPPPLLKHAVAPAFSLSQYHTFEGGQEVIWLSAPILTLPIIPAFNGSIEVDITVEDLTGNAEFGKCMIINLHCKTGFLHM